ncbi:MAG: DinB family protein [Fimbriimonadaceae bacterium]|nr:DinB family protein [Fimbriimonadaceae bacterium]
MTWYTIPALRAGPELLQAAVFRIHWPLRDRPTHPDRLSPQQIVWHLADFEEVLLSRVQAALERPGSVVENWDEEAESLKYVGRSIEEGLVRFSESRGRLVQLVAGLSGEALEGWVQHPSIGRLTVGRMLHFQNEHLLYHLVQLEEVAGSVS